MHGSCLSVSPRGSIIHIAEKAVLMTDGFGGPWREMRSGGAGGTDPVSRSGEGERASEWGLYRAKQARRFQDTAPSHLPVSPHAVHPLSERGHVPRLVPSRRWLRARQLPLPRRLQRRVPQLRRRVHVEGEGT